MKQNDLAHAETEEDKNVLTSSQARKGLFQKYIKQFVFVFTFFK